MDVTNEQVGRTMGFWEKAALGFTRLTLGLVVPTGAGIVAYNAMPEVFPYVKEAAAVVSFGVVFVAGGRVGDALSNKATQLAATEVQLSSGELPSDAETNRSHAANRRSHGRDDTR